MFYNTINLSGEKLQVEKARTLAQEDLIKAIFEVNPTTPISPSRILNVFQKKYRLNVPITSIRRGISNLAKERKDTVPCLLKTPVMVAGSYHLPEHCWIWKFGNEDKGIEKMEPGISVGDFAKLLCKQPVQKSLFEDCG